ncbi:MAG TPA: hypothetical protein VNG69_03405 [Casimicrobiaceae bacterium]|nr:hypothetical protein [Casimicrobiaceae bacterium]
MKTSALFSLLVSACLACAANAQVPAQPLTGGFDESRYPQLASMKQWLEAGSQSARQCALTGGLYLDADRVYRQTRSEPQTVSAVMSANADKLNAAERERLATIVSNVAAMAAALNDLDADSAAIAFSRMCMSRAQRPGAEPPPATIRAQFDAALRCEREYAAGGLDRKDCVARAFHTP